MRNWGVLIVRWVSGLLMAGHGAQKLFGWFGGPGLEGTAGWLESMGMRPGRPWAIVAGLSEFLGGLLTALGALNPLGSLSVISAMIMAAGTAHQGKPIWITEGGAELPLTNAAIALGVGLAGPGRYSLDRLLGLRVPRGLLALALSGAVFSILGALSSRQTPQQ